MEPLFELTLVDGLPTEIGGHTHRYHIVRLRETTVADEQTAIDLAERVRDIPGRGPALLVSEETYARAMTMLAIEQFVGDDRVLNHGEITLELVGKLSSNDWAAIEGRVMLIEASAKLRHGQMTQEQFDAMTEMAGVSPRESEGEAEQLAPDSDSSSSPVSVLSRNDAPDSESKAADVGGGVCQPAEEVE